MSGSRRVLVFGVMLALMAALGGDALAQQRGVRVKGRQAADSEQRVALVIGNSAYKGIPALRNPVNDARAMSGVLKQSGFQVTTLIDADRRGMLRAIERFGRKLRNGGVGLFYFAGHGVQARGRNYLVPLDARVEDIPDLEYEAVDAGRVLGKMEAAGNRLNIVILDACRNNPFKGNFRSARNGLAQVNAPTGSLVAYATGPGKVAADGEGRNGLYTEQLIRHMRTPGLKIEEVFKNVRVDVVRLSGGKQTPWENTSITGDFYFSGAGSSPVPPSAPPVAGAPAAPVNRMNAEEETWAIIKDSHAVADFRDFLEAFPKGRFAAAARIKIRQLERASAAARAPDRRPSDRASGAIALSPLAATLGKDDYPFTPWLAAGAFQALFDAQLKEKHFPVEVQGRVGEASGRKMNRYRARFRPFLQGKFGFYSYHGKGPDWFRRRHAELSAVGYQLVSRQEFVGAAGEARVQAVWVRGNFPAGTAAHPGETGAVCHTVEATKGWQSFALPTGRVRIASINGKWSVDHRNYPGVGAEGHVGRSARKLRPFNQYKHDLDFPFGALLMGENEDQYRHVRGREELSIRGERLLMRINDHDSALGDNGGRLKVCFNSGPR